MTTVDRLLAAFGWRIGEPALLAATLAAVVAAAAVGAVGISRRRALFARTFGQLGPRVAPDLAPRRSATRYALACLGLALLALAAGRPEQGARVPAAAVSGLDLAVLLDASLSMQAHDATPDRLTRAKRDLAALLERLPEARVAIVAFAADAHVQAPLTADLAAATLLLDAVDPAAMPAQGTDVAAALLAAERALAPASDRASTRVAVLVGDGEDHGEGAAAASRRLASQGIAVFTAGVGTIAGAPVTDATGKALVDPSGAAVVSRLDEQRLARLAALGGGEYVRLDGGGAAVARLSAALERAKLTAGAGAVAPLRSWAGRFDVFAIPGLVLLAIATALPDAARRQRPRWRRRGAPALLASAGGLVLVALGPFLAGSSPFLAEHERLAEANALAPRDPEAALRLIHEVEVELGPRAELDLDRGIALFHARRFAEARRSFALGARGSAPVASRSVYAEGVAALAQGDEAAAREAWRRALVLDPSNGSARHDLEVLLRRARERAQVAPRREGDEAEPQRGQASDVEATDTGTATPGEPGASGAARGGSGEAAGAQRDAAPMTVAEAERLLDEVAARERAMPANLPRGRVTAPTKGW